MKKHKLDLPLRMTCAPGLEAELEALRQRLGAAPLWEATRLVAKLNALHLKPMTRFDLALLTERPPRPSSNPDFREMLAEACGRSASGQEIVVLRWTKSLAAVLLLDAEVADAAAAWPAEIVSVCETGALPDLLRRLRGS